MSRVFKILGAAEWAAARAEGAFQGSAVDRKDGYIHLSSAEQAAETARLHFRGQPDLLLLACDSDALGDALRWEASRGGALFPHLYGPLLLETVVAYGPLERDTGGAVKLPVTG